MGTERAKVHVEGAPTRCPFCHDEAGVDGTVACVACLARHHVGCWDEAGRCAACGVELRLEARAVERTVAADDLPPPDVAARALAVFGRDALLSTVPGARDGVIVILTFLSACAAFPLLAFSAANPKLFLLGAFCVLPALGLWGRAVGRLVTGERRPFHESLAGLSGRQWAAFASLTGIPLLVVWLLFTPSAPWW